MAVEAALFHDSFTEAGIIRGSRRLLPTRIKIALLEEGLVGAGGPVHLGRSNCGRSVARNCDVSSPSKTPATRSSCRRRSGPAPDTSTTGDPAFNSPWSFLGLPAVSFPIGLSPDGLPLALQLVGIGPGVDLDLLETASWCEDVVRRAPSSRAWRSD